MGLFKNIAFGGSRPKKDGNTIRCGDCREVIQPDARRCPHCGAKIFTLRGRFVRRTAVILGAVLIFTSNQGGITGTIRPVVGLALLLVATYYYLKRPIHYVKPPHHPNPEQ